jgi:hypothetical protein
MSTSSLYNIIKNIKNENNFDEYHNFKNKLENIKIDEEYGLAFSSNSLKYSNKNLNKQVDETQLQFLIIYNSEYNNYNYNKNNNNKKIRVAYNSHYKINEFNILNFTTIKSIKINFTDNLESSAGYLKNQAFSLHLDFNIKVDEIIIYLENLIKFSSHYLSNNIKKYHIVNCHHYYLNRYILPNSIKIMYVKNVSNMLFPLNLKYLKIDSVNLQKKKFNKLKILIIDYIPQYNIFNKVEFVELNMHISTDENDIYHNLSNLRCNTLFLNMTFYRDDINNNNKIINFYENTQNIIIDINSNYNSFMPGMPVAISPNTLFKIKFNFPNNVNYLSFNKNTNFSYENLKINKMPKNINYLEIINFTEHCIDLSNVNTIKLFYYNKLIFPNLIINKSQISIKSIIDNLYLHDSTDKTTTKMPNLNNDEFNKIIHIITRLIHKIDNILYLNIVFVYK